MFIFNIPNDMNRHYHIIGAGGVGSWLLPALVKLADQHDSITIHDGDDLELKNMDRQLFRKEDIGSNKAEALSSRYKNEAQCMMYTVPRYFSGELEGVIGSPEYTWLLGCADNHPARKLILEACDTQGYKSIIGGNGYTDADAYFYESSMRGTPCDPRVYYPDILTDTTGSPIHAAGCTGEAQDETPQLVLANMWAAAHMLHLLWYHTEIAKDIPEDMEEHMPMLSRNSAYMFETVKKGMIKGTLER